LILAQVKKVAYDVDPGYYIGEATSSTSVCFSNCIADPQCIFVRHSFYHDNYLPYCYYIHEYNNTKHPSIPGEFGLVDGN
jgi:hypothetical protein